MNVMGGKENGKQEDGGMAGRAGTSGAELGTGLRSGREGWRWKRERKVGSRETWSSVRAMVRARIRDRIGREREERKRKNVIGGMDIWKH